MTIASRMLIHAYRRAEDAKVQHDFAQEQELIIAVQLEFLEPEGVGTSAMAGAARAIKAWSSREKISHQNCVAEYSNLVREIIAAGYKPVLQDHKGCPCLPYVIKPGKVKGKRFFHKQLRLPHQSRLTNSHIKQESTLTPSTEVHRVKCFTSLSVPLDNDSLEL